MKRVPRRNRRTFCPPLRAKLLKKRLSRKISCPELQKRLRRPALRQHPLAVARDVGADVEGDGAAAEDQGARPGPNRAMRPMVALSNRHPRAWSPGRIFPSRRRNLKTSDSGSRGIIVAVMSLRSNSFWTSALTGALVVGLSAQTPAPPSSNRQGSQQTPTFRVQIDAVTMDVVVKDDQGRFIPDLKKDEFEIYEDGVKQELSSMTMSHGGRVTNMLEAPPPPPPEGIILPPVRRIVDQSGRIFLFFVDDLHMQFQNSGRVRQLFQKMQKNLIHEGDLFGMVSSGTSSISQDMTYDRKRMDEAIQKIAGSGLKPSEIIQRGIGGEGSSELRHNAHVAFSTMREALVNLEKVHNRRKVLIWVSEGYDFNPFQDSRLGLKGDNTGFQQNESAAMRRQGLGDQTGNQAHDSVTDSVKQSETFSDADLAFELGEITRAANRANTTIYTVDPRGLVAGTDIEENIDPQEWATYVRKSQDSMRVLAEETGGLAVVNMNNFDKALQQIDAASSDYYVLGYYSSNPDPTKRRRQVEVKVLRKNVQVFSRKEYVLKPPPKSSAPAAKQ
jgi:VWFA-related protein